MFETCSQEYVLSAVDDHDVVFLVHLVGGFQVPGFWIAVQIMTIQGLIVMDHVAVVHGVVVHVVDILTAVVHVVAILTAVVHVVAILTVVVHVVEIPIVVIHVV